MVFGPHTTSHGNWGRCFTISCRNVLNFALIDWCFSACRVTSSCIDIDIFRLRKESHLGMSTDNPIFGGFNPAFLVTFTSKSLPRHAPLLFIFMKSVKREKLWIHCLRTITNVGWHTGLPVCFASRDSSYHALIPFSRRLIVQFGEIQPWNYLFHS